MLLVQFFRCHPVYKKMGNILNLPTELQAKTGARNNKLQKKAAAARHQNKKKWRSLKHYENLITEWKTLEWIVSQYTKDLHTYERILISVSLANIKVTAYNGPLSSKLCYKTTCFGLDDNFLHTLKFRISWKYFDPPWWNQRKNASRKENWYSQQLHKV